MISLIYILGQTCKPLRDWVTKRSCGERVKLSMGAAENDRKHLSDLDVGTMGYKTPWEQRTSSKHGKGSICRDP